MASDQAHQQVDRAIDDQCRVSFPVQQRKPATDDLAWQANRRLLHSEIDNRFQSCSHDSSGVAGVTRISNPQQIREDFTHLSPFRNYAAASLSPDKNCLHIGALQVEQGDAEQRGSGRTPA
ncbi:hypothetical protein [Planctomicrobium sp. SH664]|uniref:hypothetical protein n=1 Tax=Planctomicrobium sp. SH664 TaxID=3448125 RepID=UPI003F5BD6E3